MTFLKSDLHFREPLITPVLILIQHFLRMRTDTLTSPTYFSTSLQAVVERSKVCTQPVIRIRYDDFDDLVAALFPGVSYCIASTIEATRDTYKVFHADITTSSVWDPETRQTATIIKSDPFEKDPHLTDYLERWSKNPHDFTPEPHDFCAFFLQRKLWSFNGKPISKAIFLVEF